VTLDSSAVTAYLQNVGNMSKHSETTGGDIDLSAAAEPDAQWRIGIDNPSATPVTVGYSISYDSD
jgi:hypothetical protein